MTRSLSFMPWLLASALLGCSKSNPSPSPTVATGSAPRTASESARPGAKRVSPDQVTRITPTEAHRKVQAGSALLVCAYPDDAKFHRAKLEGAIPLSELEKKRASLPLEQELIFYCA